VLTFPLLTKETAAALSVDLPVKASSIKLNAGAHWAATVFVGQIAAEGRLEVTALGDEVNEAARVQESARDGRVLASKAILERLSPGDAARVGVDPVKLEYQPLGSVEGVPEKAVRDAGHLAIVALRDAEE
jgi:class 3 adenylate cyclase